MNEETLLIRADATVAMGTGHVMRCLALAQVWQEAGGKVVFALAKSLPSVKERLLSEGMEVVLVEGKPGSPEDARRTAQLANQCTAAWVVVDGYHFGADYQQELKAAGLQVLFVDDTGHASHYAADLVLNQNVNADESLYPKRESYTRLLLGSSYVLLRREFWRWHGWKREIPAFGGKLLITMGGSDPDNLTFRALEAVAQANCERLETVVVVGGSNPHQESLRLSAAECKSSVSLVSDPSMPDLMAWADLALTTAGGTLWELLFMGCSVLSYARDRNQEQIISQLHEEGIVLGLVHPRESNNAQMASALFELANSPERRAGFSARARARIDGRGAQRVLDSLRASERKDGVALLRRRKGEDRNLTAHLFAVERIFRPHRPGGPVRLAG